MTAAKRYKAPKAPCKSCPYRRDVPAGVWHPEEYAKLPKYDGETFEQIDGGLSLFLCHQGKEELCGGWLACHDPGELLALRLHGHEVDPSVFRYKTSVPVFGSGREAAEHGLSGVDDPDERALRTINRLDDKLGLSRFSLDDAEDLS